MTDLWPDDFGKIDFDTPLAILRQQAAALERKTAGLVTAHVEPYRLKSGFGYNFYLVAPSLDDYSYRLFAVQHRVDLYPVSLILEPGGGVLGQEFECQNESEFKDCLRKVFSSVHTKKVIQAILAQVQSLTAPTGEPMVS